MIPAVSREMFKEKKVCVLMPTYNNEQTLGRVLASLLEFTDQIIVVNDGSTDSTASVLQQFPQLNVVSYSKNKGKGYALRTGFRHAVKSGYDYAITIDSDGQHFADDLHKFLTKLESHPEAIIIGARNMDQASVPGKSSFGNKFSNFWFWVETGLTMSDTQSGYRLYPVRLLNNFNFLTRKFEFEIEVLVTSSWRGIEITEVPVRVFYADKESRVSHFRPFKDFTRISILNTFLVTIALLYIKPRDFLRGIKKKNSGKRFMSNSSAPLSRIGQKPAP
ncbi:MAG TPA: glycosyltransferase family 2 protein [Chryseolinea sp.]